MPKIARNSLVNLTAFRQRNGILQKDLAEYLGVSRGYISLVESGRSNLSPENIDKIFDNPNHWNTDDLVPAYTRLNRALYYLNRERNEQRAAEGLGPAFFTFLPDDESELAIKHGYGDIPEHLADQWCPEAPELSREWLLYGEGEMLVQDTPEEPTPIEVLQAKVDKLEAAIEEYKNTVERLVDSLSKQITDALQVMSNK